MEIMDYGQILLIFMVELMIPDLFIPANRLFDEYSV